MGKNASVAVWRRAGDGRAIVDHGRVVETAWARGTSGGEDRYQGWHGDWGRPPDRR